MVGMIPQAPILTVTLNPALDLFTAADAVRPGVKLRCETPAADPGGGGILVSRAIRQMGGQSTALLALGGGTGARIAAMLKAEGLSVVRLTAPGETRQSLAVTDRATGETFRFVMPGPEWHAAHLADMTRAVADAAPAGGWVVVTGSVPPGVPAGFAQMLAVRLKDRGARLVVDTAGEALRVLAGSSTPVEVLRMANDEAESLSGRPLPGSGDSAEFAASLVRDGVARWVVVARGAEGSVMAGPGGTWRDMARPDDAAGAGARFLGGLVLALARGGDAARALEAAATAAGQAHRTGGRPLAGRVPA